MARMYEVLAGRQDIPTEVVGRFEASCDQEAKSKFLHDFVENKRYSWEDLRLDEVVQERKTRVGATVAKKNLVAE